jgi:hypothetical protein
LCYKDSILHNYALLRPVLLVDPDYEIDCYDGLTGIPSLNSLQTFTIHRMYQRVSPNQARSDDYTFDVPLGHLSPNATGAGPQPEKSRDKTYIVPTSVPTDHLLQRPINDLKDGNNVLSTLHRTAFRQWFATLFDALMSLIPLFFLGKTHFFHRCKYQS